jgi:protein-disulfide isomerase
MGFKYTFFVAVCVLASVLVTLLIDRQFLTPPAPETTLTKEQSEKILAQLTEVRKSLQRIERKQAERGRRPSVPKTASAPTKGRPTLGAPDAGITVVEFTDYQCPFCSRFATTTFDRIRQAYIDTGKVRWVVLDMPLSFHKEALMASQAAHCANEQGRFWEFRALMYQNQDKLQAEHLAEYARQTGIEVESFNQCLNSDRFDAVIEKDRQEAVKQQITGTPTFVIGRTTPDVITGKRIVGAQAYRVFSSEIDRLLKVK